MKKKLLAGILAGILALTPVESTVVMANTKGVSEPVCGVQKSKKFTIKVTSGIKGYKRTGSSWINKKTFQICYRQKKGKNKNKIVIRKTKGNASVSGGGNTETVISDFTANIQEVRFRGNRKTVSVATWKSGKYTYSITSSKPVRLKTMISLVKKIK
ncbi:hypothetical protein [Blautia sp. MSJ-19]|uniref:hypothetical protein n=1 Tax=Blautia sp. MSJ-19 TaxID=2841517 RepID=UPI001C0F02FE|nr:hypothetical protein [Blautia sp. MSJ-19]MBU5482228.1 hypothetical protein [Blautia sp. MSJ-19]